MIDSIFRKLNRIFVLLTCVTIVVPSQRIVLEVQRETTIVDVGDNIKLECSIAKNITDGSLIGIIWEAPNGAIIRNGSVLHLNNIRLPDVGDYRCKAEEVVDNSSIIFHEMIHTIRLNNTRNEKSWPNIIVDGIDESRNLNLTEAQSFRVFCYVNNWLKRDYNVKWIQHNRVREFYSADLFISSIRKSKDEGRYHCIVQHKSNTSLVGSMYINLHITVPTLSVTILPTENLKINGSIERKCVASNSSDPEMNTRSFKWFNNRNETVSHDAILRIFINDSSVFGVYECQNFSNNSRKIYTVQTNITENVSETPNQKSYKIIISSSPPAFRINEKFTLRCQITPELSNATYTWSKKGVAYASVQTLVFDKFKKKNLGVYQCCVTGFTEAGIKLDVVSTSYQRLSYFSIVLTRHPGPYIGINRRDYRALRCELEESSNMTGNEVVWYFNGIPVNKTILSTKRLMRLDKRRHSILVLLNAGDDNEGTYECEYQSKRKEANVIIQTGNGVISVNPSIIKVFEGEPVEFRCHSDNDTGADSRQLHWTHYNNARVVVSNISSIGWVVRNTKLTMLTSFITLNESKLSDSGVVICSHPDGRSDRGQLIVLSRHFNVTIIPREVAIRQNSSFMFDCLGQTEDGSLFGKPSVTIHNGTDILNATDYVITEVNPSRIRVTSRQGIYVNKELIIVCAINEKETVLSIKVQDHCYPDDRFCRNGQCIHNGGFCDSIRDCDDGSDEHTDFCAECNALETLCGIVNGVQPDRYEIYTQSKCDGINNCGNNFDELSCNEYDSQCNGMFFTCPNNVTVPRGRVCNGYANCDGSEDEIGCAHAVLNSTSAMHVKGYLGQTVTLQCNATGYPLPGVIWRASSRCLPDLKRMHTSNVKDNCNKIVSTFTIEDFRYGDDGYYDCYVYGIPHSPRSDYFRVVVA